jgi:hypothetical protein
MLLDISSVPFNLALSTALHAKALDIPRRRSLVLDAEVSARLGNWVINFKFFVFSFFLFLCVRACLRV